jgi:hypothetical protein
MMNYPTLLVIYDNKARVIVPNIESMNFSHRISPETHTIVQNLTVVEDTTDKYGFPAKKIHTLPSEGISEIALVFFNGPPEEDEEDGL